MTGHGCAREGREEEEEGEGVGQLGGSPWAWFSAACEEGNRKKEKRREEKEEKRRKRKEKKKGKNERKKERNFFSNLEISKKIKDTLRSWSKIIFVEERYLLNYK
jgi:hypothetical protein